VLTQAGQQKSKRQAKGPMAESWGPISRWLHPSSADTSWLDATGRFDMDSSADAGKSQRKRLLVNDETSASTLGTARLGCQQVQGRKKYSRGRYTLMRVTHNPPLATTNPRK
jgi:hypothetical protein